MRAKPVFAFTLVASALALPDVAHALALGRLTVTSALGQPLSAYIELAAVTREELESLTAKVADANQYRASNLTYQSVLARTRVTVERGTDGRPILRITSPQLPGTPLEVTLVGTGAAPPPPPDAGVDNKPSGDSGCGCRSSGGGLGVLPIALVLVPAVVRRRRCRLR